VRCQTVKNCRVDKGKTTCRELINLQMSIGWSLNEFLLWVVNHTENRQLWNWWKVEKWKMG